MPIEVRELVIKATVAGPNGSGAAAPSNPGGNNTSAGQDAMVKACVDQVLAILKEKDAR